MRRIKIRVYRRSDHSFRELHVPAHYITYPPERLLPQLGLDPNEWHLSVHPASRVLGEVVFYRSTRGIGDAIMLTAAIECVVRQCRAKSVVLAIQRQLWDVFTHNPYVTRLTTPEEFPNFKHAPLEGMFDLSTACADYESSHEPYVQKNRPQVWVEHCGFQWSPTEPRIYLSHEEEQLVTELELSNPGPRIGVGYQSIDYWRNYPHMKQLIQQLSEIAGVVWVFHHKKVSLPRKKNVVQPDTKSLRDLFIYIAACDVVIAPDTAHLHIAGALQVPVYAIFGPTDPAIRLKDYQIPKRTPPAYRACGRQPCWYKPCNTRPCLTTLNPESIVESVRGVL